MCKTMKQTNNNIKLVKSPRRLPKQGSGGVNEIPVLTTLGISTK